MALGVALGAPRKANRIAPRLTPIGGTRITKSSGLPAPAMDCERVDVGWRELLAPVELPIVVAPVAEAALGLPDVAIAPAFTEFRSAEPADAAACVAAAVLPPCDPPPPPVEPDKDQLFSPASPGVAEPAEPSELAALVTDGDVGAGPVGEDDKPEPLTEPPPKPPIDCEAAG